MAATARSPPFFCSCLSENQFGLGPERTRASLCAEMDVAEDERPWLQRVQADAARMRQRLGKCAYSLSGGASFFPASLSIRLIRSSGRARPRSRRTSHAAACAATCRTAVPPALSCFSPGPKGQPGPSEACYHSPWRTARGTRDIPRIPVRGIGLSRENAHVYFTRPRGLRERHSTVVRRRGRRRHVCAGRTAIGTGGTLLVSPLSPSSSSRSSVSRAREIRLLTVPTETPVWAAITS